MYLRKYKITYDKSNEGYFKRYLNGESSKLHYLVYEFITGEKVDTSKYEIDHFNSNPKDNTFNNLLKIDKNLYDIKLKSIEQFVFPYTIDLKMNDTKDRFIIVLSDLGVRNDGSTIMLNYDDNYMLFLEYNNINDLVFDLDLFKSIQWTYSDNEKLCGSIKEELNFIRKEYGDTKNIDELYCKIRTRNRKNKAINMAELKMSENKFDECTKIYVSHNYLTGNQSKGRFSSNSCFLNFDIFSKNDEELNKMGLTKI